MANKYAVLARTTNMQLTTSKEASEQDAENTQNYTVSAGTLIKIATESQITTETQIIEPQPTTTALVYVYDEVLREPNTKRRFQCAVDSLLPVSDKLWPFIVSIPEPHRRLQLLLNEERCKWFCEATPGEFVTVPGRCLDNSDSSMCYDCTISYIGPVPEIHPVGYFFGLNLLKDTPSPQATHVPFTRKYFDCDPENAIFTTADRIVEIPAYETTPSSTVDEEESRSDWSINSFYNFAVNKIRSTLPI